MARESSSHGNPATCLCKPCIHGKGTVISLLSAGYDSRLRLLGVSTVAGNQTVERVTLNALGLLTAAGLHDIRESLPAIFACCASRTV